MTQLFQQRVLQRIVVQLCFWQTGKLLDHWEFLGSACSISAGWQIWPISLLLEIVRFCNEVFHAIPYFFSRFGSRVKLHKFSTDDGSPLLAVVRKITVILLWMVSGAYLICFAWTSSTPQLFWFFILLAVLRIATPVKGIDMGHGGYAFFFESDVK